MEENNKIVVTREYEKKMSEISPFELKDILFYYTVYGCRLE